MSRINSFENFPEKHFRETTNFFLGPLKELEDGGVVNEAQIWKMAHLNDPYSKMFTGLSFGKFTLNQTSTCETEGWHLPPVHGCECGFYGFNELNRAIDLFAHARALVLIKAEFYGSIIVHDHGLRAEEQEIREIYINDTCSKIFCRRPTVGVVKRRKNWFNVCEKHITPSFIDLEKLGFLFKIKVGTFNRKQYRLQAVN